MKRNHSRGFTLIEMLVVIAIIAVLVAIIIPTVTSATTKANAATDAANLRSILGEANTVFLSGDKDPAGAVKIAAKEKVKSKSFPDAKLYIVYTVPGFIDVYFVENAAGEGESFTGDAFYGLDYFSQLAESGETTASTQKPVFPAEYREVWHLLAEEELIIDN